MDTGLIKDLILAHSEPGKSEPIEVNGLVIPKQFTTIFIFQDHEKTWSCHFYIKIGELGTPKLMSVSVSGSVAKDNRPNPINKTWDSSNFNELIEIMQGKKPRFTKAELKQIRELQETAPEPESVQRWQLKRIEQYRFQLFELAVKLAYQYGEPKLTKFPSGEIKLAWLDRKTYSEQELKELQKEIGKKIRKKVTPELLKEVAKIYTEASARGEFPTKAVSEFYKCERRTAEDYVKASRDMNFLPPAPKTHKKAVRKPTKKKGVK